MVGNLNLGCKLFVVEFYLINGNLSKKFNLELVGISKLFVVVCVVLDCFVFFMELVKEEWLWIVGDFQLMGVVVWIDCVELVVYC